MTDEQIAKKMAELKVLGESWQRALSACSLSCVEAVEHMRAFANTGVQLNEREKREIGK